jgi:hypothetical protein
VVVLFESWREQLGAILRRLSNVGRKLAGRRKMSIFGELFMRKLIVERKNNRVSEVHRGPCSPPRGCSPHLIVALDNYHLATIPTTHWTIAYPHEPKPLTSNSPQWPPKHPNSAPSTAASCARCRPASPPSSPTRRPCKSTSAPTSRLNHRTTRPLWLTNCKPNPPSRDSRKRSRSCSLCSSSAFTLRWLRDTTRA